MLDDYEPLVRVATGAPAVENGLTKWRAQIPNEVTEYYLQRVGFECEDVRL